MYTLPQNSQTAMPGQRNVQRFPEPPLKFSEMQEYPPLAPQTSYPQREPILQRPPGPQPQPAGTRTTASHRQGWLLPETAGAWER